MKKALCFLILFFAVTVTPATASQDTIQQYIDAISEKRTDVEKLLERKLLETEPSLMGVEDHQYVELLLDIGERTANAGAFGRAERAYQTALNFSRTEFGNTDLRVRSVLQQYAVFHESQGQLGSAFTFLEESLSIAEKRLGPSHSSLRYELNLLSKIYSKRDNIVQLEKVARRLSEIAQSEQEEKGASQFASELATNKSSRVFQKSSDPCSGNGADKEESTHHRLQVYYGTHRVKTEQTSTAYAYGNEFDESRGIVYGTVFVTVPCNRQIGEVPLPKLWLGEFRSNKSKHIVLEKHSEIESANFWSNIENKLKATNKKEILVYIHGFWNDFRAAAARTAQLAVDLELDGAPVFYDWPSKASAFSYDADREIATSQVITDYAAQFLSDIVEKTGAEKINVIAHSLGNEVLLRAMEELADNQYRDVEDKPFDHLIFASPDVNVANFRSLVSEAEKIATNMTLYTSGNDIALQASAFKLEFGRAGDASNRIISKKITTVDTTNASSGLIGHNDFTGKALDDLRAVLWLNAIPSKRCILSAKTIQEGNYWSLEPQCNEEVFSSAVASLRRLGHEGARVFADKRIRKASDNDNAEQRQYWESILEEIVRIEG